MISASLLRKQLLLLSLLFFPSISRADISTGLIGYWKFDETSGATTTDASGNGNAGALLNSPARIDGKRGLGLDFPYVDRTTSPYVNFGSILNQTTGSFSYCIWAKYSTQNSNNNYPGIISTDHGSAGYGLLVDTAGGATDNFPFGSIGDGATGAYVSAVSAKNDGLWHHYAVTVDRSAQLLTFYIDGVSQGSADTTAVGSVSNPAESLLVGQRNDNTGIQNPFTGSVDDFRFYSRAVTANDVAELYGRSMIRNAHIESTRKGN